MSPLLYAITDRCAMSDVGEADGPLRAISAAGLAAIVGEAGSPVRPTAERMWAYEQRVEALMDRCTILPARFGTVVTDDRAVQELLHQRRDEFLRALERVRGTVEMGVSARWHGPVAVRGEDGPGDAGTAYMLGRLETLRAARAIADRLGPLLERARTGRISILPRPGVPLRGAYLVARDEVPAFADACERLDRELPAATLECTGPWPPYSFARGSETEASFARDGDTEAGFARGATADASFAQAGDAG